jgi:cation diffusion facilitator CzcD-associated flavoprotein CzcO
MGSQPPPPFSVRRVAIIGAGPSGLAAAKYLRAQGSFEHVIIFEQQDQAGGIWNYSQQATKRTTVPQTSPFVGPEAPFRKTASSSKEAPVFPSALYDDLHANIPKSLMNFSDQKFPDDAWIYPSRQAIQQYLLEYAQDVRGLIRFCFQVKKITLQRQDDLDKWHLEAHSTVGDETISDIFDAVVVANGHYAVPFIPLLPNVEAFQKTHPSVIIHSNQYRTANAFSGKKTLVVGNGPSGLDIARQVNVVSKGQTLISVKAPTPAAVLGHAGCSEVAEIEEFLPAQRGVRFRDGHVEVDIDTIIICTGFLFSYPFLPGLQEKLLTSGRGVHGLYKHLFSIEHPTLAFPALNMKAVPWPVAEAQAAAFAAVWSNNLELPPVAEMQQWTRNLEVTQGEPLHVFFTLAQDGEYINEMHDWAVQASHLGKQPPRWNDELLWQRRIFTEGKRMFEQQGCKATTLEELGLFYKPEVGRTADLIIRHADINDS